MSDVIEQRPKDVVHSKRSYKLYIIYNFWLYFFVVICFFSEAFPFCFWPEFYLESAIFYRLALRRRDIRRGVYEYIYLTDPYHITDNAG